MVEQRRVIRRILLIAGMAGCATLQPFVPPPARLDPDVAELGWLAARWVSDDHSTEETWSPAGDALIGVSFTAEQGRTLEWEVLILARDEHGTLVYKAMPDGHAPVIFTLSAANGQAARFSNPAHDFPKHISYARREAGPISRLGIRLAGDGPTAEFAMVSIPIEHAAEVEEADRQFQADVAERGIDGWVDGFDEQGARVDDLERIEGRAAIRESMREFLGDGGHRLRWAPTASGLSPARDLGFTLGAWATEKRDATRDLWEESARGAYVTIWRRGADGHWKVLFDTGDVDQGG